MKILVIQLARYGDIVMTVPVVRALRAKWGAEAEIHFLARQRFADIAKICKEIDQIWAIDSQEVLGPVIENHTQLSTSIHRMNEVVDQLCSRGYEMVINLSFSPLSSYLTKAISRSGAEVFGYSRFNDGYLDIPDDASAYFYGQVGVGKHNRVHVTDLFALIAGVELSEECWGVNLEEPIEIELPNDYLVLHVGASRSDKVLPVFKWAQIVRRLEKGYKGEIVLIGALNEMEAAGEIAGASTSKKVVNLVGKTNVQDLFSIIMRARLVVGADSLPMQVASLVGTAGLNISFPTVNFWETGPRSPGSRVIYTQSAEELSSDRVTTEVLNMVAKAPPQTPSMVWTGKDIIGYEECAGAKCEYHQWHLVEALYMDGDFPHPQSQIEKLGYQRLYEVAILALEQLPNVLIPDKRVIATGILVQVDDILLSIDKMVPDLSPIISWFQTERLRIGPGPLELVVERTVEIFRRLKLVGRVFAEEIESNSMVTEERASESQEVVEKRIGS